MMLEWTMPLMIGLITLVLLFGSLLMFLDKVHVVVKLFSFLMLPFMMDALTAFMINVAKQSQMDAIVVIFSGLFKGSIAITILSIAYVIVYFIAQILNSIKENKEKKQIDLVQ